MVIFENKMIKILYDESIPAILWIPIEFMDGENFRNPFIKAVEFYENNIKDIPKLGWLCDARKLKSVKPEDVRWIMHINERAQKFGAPRVAFVLPENIFGKMAIKLYVEVTMASRSNLLQIKAFSNFDKAKYWLKDIQIGQMDEIKL